MRFGITILPQASWPGAGRQWTQAEELGFDHAWTYDHLAWTSLAGESWGATIPTLTAAAMVTNRIRLGTFVSNPNFRHPVPFAKELATLDDISGGRFVLGVSSGAAGSFDSAVLGEREYSRRERHERFVEFVELLDRLLRFEPDAGEGARAGESAQSGEGAQAGIDFEGAWYTARAARMVGLPAQQPRLPFAIAANGPKGLDLVARLGQAWITNGPSVTDDAEWWAAIRTLTERFEMTMTAHGRDPASIDRHLSFDAVNKSRFAFESVDAFEDAVGRAAELGFTDLVVHWPRAEGVYSGAESVLIEVASRLDRYR